jgi:diguanylate cyclase (GGDEF)-like protein
MADGALRNRSVVLPPDSLDRMMPMHLHLSVEGRVIGHGPTLEKVAAGLPLIGTNFFEVFHIRRPAGVLTMADLSHHQGRRLFLSLQDRKDAEFRAVAMPDCGSGLLLNLSFGIGVVDAVRAHGLTNADFAPTDLTVELLYLVEATHAVRAELKKLNDRLEWAKSEAEEQALTDPLTGLANRRALDLRLAAACRAKLPFALMHLDLDHFKAVNDTLGHAAGDHVLCQVADVLQAETRASDVIARVGGDEFVILLPGMVDPAVLHTVAARIISGLRRPMVFEGETCQIGASVGMTVSTHYAQPAPEKMLADADAALYAAKKAGRAQARMWSEPG